MQNIDHYAGDSISEKVKFEYWQKTLVYFFIQTEFVLVLNILTIYDTNTKCMRLH